MHYQGRIRPSRFVCGRREEEEMLMTRRAKKREERKGRMVDRSSRHLYSRLRLGIFACLLRVALPLLSTAKATGEGGGAGGMPSSRFLEDLLPTMEREKSWEKESRASWVVGGATPAWAVLEAATEAILRIGDKVVV